MSNYRKVAVLFLAVAFLLTLPGCAGKPTKANFEKIENGMSFAKVKSILGAPDETKEGSGGLLDVTAGGKICTWKTADDETLTVTFDKDDKVVAKAGF